MKQPIKQVRDWLLYQLLRACAAIVQRLSEERLHTLAERLGNWLYDGLRLRRKLVEQNLLAAFPEKSAEERATIARKIYHGQALNLLEVLRLPLVRTRQDAQALFEIDPSVIDLHCFSKGRGGVIVSAHFGNWELMAVCWALATQPIAIVYKPLSNPYLNALLNQWRTQCGNELITMQEAPRLGLRRLREGKLLALLSDQSGHSDGYFMPFLGRPASVFLGAAVFALRTNLPMLLAMPIRTASGKYRLEITHIPTDDLTYSQENVHKLAARYTHAIEAYIRRYPEQWFWLHNRWKHQPSLETAEVSNHQMQNETL
ncbi:MAG: lysophospholipid acyltransferase family protein [Candidatus Thermochlorobacter sp.]